MTELRLVVHDYSGHPFQLQLSRELAHIGHKVVHQYSSDFVTGKGALEVHKKDSPLFSIEALSLGQRFQKYSLSRRIRQELRYGRLLAEKVIQHRPDVVVMCNVPLLAHSIANRALRRAGVPSVFWHQDVYSHAIADMAEDRLGNLGRVLGKIAVHLEARIARDSAVVVPISTAFVPVLTGWGLPRDRIVVIPNWGAVDELPLRPRDNPWALTHGLANRPVVMYTGTLGLKHDPDILFELAQSLARTDPEARLVVISEGRGREHLARRLLETPTPCLMLLDFQPYEQMPDVMGTADLLVAVLERDASRYSVPSKVLSYLCAGRPVLAVMPQDNGAADTLRRSGAGVVVPPGQIAAAETAVRALLDDPARRADMGRAARRYAETHFDVSAIAKNFEDVLVRAAQTQ